MMVETILESSQDFGMSNGVLPQWKREILQRRAARSRPPPATPPAPPAPPHVADDEDEELRYGPGIVKRLKSRYLSLALRDAPRRRPSVLRRAASLEHLIDERPPPAPRHVRTARPLSVVTPPAASHPPRRDSVKRARSVDALSRLEPRDEPPPSPPPAPPQPRPPVARAGRPPRRPVPLLRDTERPPPDVVRSALRVFESAPPRRAAPAARVSAVLRGLEANRQRCSTPELRARSPSPAVADISAVDAGEHEEPSMDSPALHVKQVSRAALDGIARAGSTMRYSFEAPRAGSHLPPLATTNPVLLNRVRQIGVIRPMPAPVAERTSYSPVPSSDDFVEKLAETTPRIVTPPPVIDDDISIPIRLEKRDPPPSALVEPIPRSPSESRQCTASPCSDAVDRREPSPEPPISKPIVIVTDKIAKDPLVERITVPEMVISEKITKEVTIEKIVKCEVPKIDNSIVKTEQPKSEKNTKAGFPCSEKFKTPEPLMNGHTESERITMKASRFVGASVERAWNGTGEKKCTYVSKEKQESECRSAAWARGSPGAARRLRAPPPAATSIVFNFSDRKEVPDYIENDGLIMRAKGRDKIKAGDSGVVVLRVETAARAASDSEEEECGPPSPCGVRFVNDNVLINGRSSMPTRPNRDRIAKLKLQFDDSLTRTFEYPSETSLCEECPSPSSAAATGAPSAAAAPADTSPIATLAANTHIASAALARYTPSKTLADEFQLGVTRHEPAHRSTTQQTEGAECDAEVSEGGEGGDARPCGADAARSWSEARTHATDLLF